MIKAVIFDLNGVFLQSEKLSDRIERDYGVKSAEFIEALIEIMNKVMVPNAPHSYQFWQPYLQKWNLNLSEEDFLEYWFSGEKLVPELLDYAKELRKQEIMVFLLSNNFKERTEYYRKHFPQIFSNVTYAYFSWETGFVKPDQKAYQKVLQDNDLSAEDCVYFDDSEKNVNIARALGIHAFQYKGLSEMKETVDKLIYRY